MLETSLILEPVFVRPLPFSFPLLIYLYQPFMEGGTPSITGPMGSSCHTGNQLTGCFPIYLL